VPALALEVVVDLGEVCAVVRVIPIGETASDKTINPASRENRQLETIQSSFTDQAISESSAWLKRVELFLECQRDSMRSDSRHNVTVIT
jgi:hypothetical protein